MLLFSSNSQLKGYLYGVHPLATSTASARLRGGLCDNESGDDKTQTPTQQIHGEVLCVNSPTTGSSQATTPPLQFPGVSHYSNAPRCGLNPKWKIESYPKEY